MEEGQKGVALDSCTATHCDICHGQVIPVQNVKVLFIPDRGEQGDLKVYHLQLRHLSPSCYNSRLAIRLYRHTVIEIQSLPYSNVVSSGLGSLSQA